MSRLPQLLPAAGLVAMAMNLLGAEVSPAPRAGTGGESAPPPAAHESYRLNTGDRVSYRVLEDREEPRPLTVTDSGELEIPHLGRVKASGKTCKQLGEEIRTGLEASFYRRATVQLSIDVLARARGKVQVIGEVTNPGTYDIPADETFTVGKAILRAGGFKPFASRSRVNLLRKAPGAGAKTETRRLDFDEIWNKGRIEKDVPLQADDVIVVRARIFNL